MSERELRIPKDHVSQKSTVKTLYRFDAFACLMRGGQVVATVDAGQAARQAASAVDRARLSSRDRRRARRLWRVGRRARTV